MRIQSFAFAAAILSLALTKPTIQAQQPVPDSPAIEQKVDAMLAKLTLQQKLELIGGVDSFYIRAEPDAGFPRLKMSDGPMGVRTWGPDTAYAGGIALAATWDPAIVRRMGESIAQDARARGVHFLLGPGVNIYRSPLNGRNFEYFGEDPFLSAHTAVPWIEGVQSQGVIATVKHFAANNQEWDRHNVSSDVDERTLREIYLPAFEAAVKTAHVGAVMDSYNLINDVHATQNDHLNNEILKKEWGFDGILMSDWVATYDGVAAANGGLDLEMPSGEFMNVKNLEPAVQGGKVSQATIDDKVRRIFRTAIRFGFLDRDQTDPSIPLYTQTGRQVALDEARESITLLKNEGNLLPLDANKIHTLAVFGPDAWPSVPGAGGSSHVTPFADVSIMTGLANYQGGKVKVLYVRGLPEVNDLFKETKFSATEPEHAVKIETFSNADFKGTPEVSYARNFSGFQPGRRAPHSEDKRSIRYTAEYLPAKTGSYLILAAAGGDDRYKVLIDGKQVLEEHRYEGQSPLSTQVSLTANRSVKVEVEYQPQSAGVRFGLGIRAAEELVAPEVAKLASTADAAIVAVGFNGPTESEGLDRTFELPWGQDELIQTVAAANKNTIVTVTAGGDVATNRWLDRVPALLENWYPGQEGGTAVAEILFGDRSPEGHLPMSWEKSWEENPTHDNYYAPPTPEGQTPHVKYSEGLYVGYRYYTSMNKQPLYAFGYGLAYTTFSFSGLEVSPDSTSADGPITVSFDVENTGQRAGATVAQVYVGDPSAKVKRPVKELKGYEKVRLQPGEKKHVAVSLDRRALAYWDVNSNGWKVDPGKFVVSVGDSSENTPLTRDFTVR